MRLASTLLLAALAATLSLAAEKPRARPVPIPKDIVPGEVLFGLRADKDTPAHAARIATGVGRLIERMDRIRVYRVALTRGVNVLDALVRLSREPDVTFAEPDAVTELHAAPSDPLFGQQYGPQITQAPAAWDSWQPVAPVTLAILDTGVAGDHSDLTGKMLRDASGHITGYDAITQTPGPVPDGHGHGTECAGIAAAQINNNEGIAGISGWNGNPASSDLTFTRIMPVKVLKNHGTMHVQAPGIAWAVDHGARVLSMSVGYHSWTFPYGGTLGDVFGPPAEYVSGLFEESSAALEQAVYHAWADDAVLVASAGNHGEPVPEVPGGLHGVVTVAASDSDDTLTSYSNWGSLVDVVAPGVGILSTIPPATDCDHHPAFYCRDNGTSMAAPHVAGEAALIRSQNPRLNNDYVSYLVRTNVDRYRTYCDRHIASGGGRINIARALAAAGKPTLSVGIAPSTVYAGIPPFPLGRVTLDTQAPPGGATVHLSTLQPESVHVPESVTVQEGATSTFFTISGGPPSWNKATIVAKYGDGVATGTLWIWADPMDVLNSLKGVLAEADIVRGEYLATHIVLSQLPRTDITVRLTTSDAAVLAVPPTVTIGAARYARLFWLKAGSVSAPRQVTITATAGNVQRSVTVTVHP